QNLMEAISACGSCLFTSYAVFPAFLVEKPNSLMTKAILKVFPYVGPVVNLLNKFTKAVKLNIPLIQHTYALNYVCDFKATLGTALTVGSHGYNMERMANIILGQKAGADVLPKRLTQVAQDPNDPRTKVPIEKLKKDYYRGRGWKDGIPKYKTLKSFGVDLYPDYYDRIVKEAMSNG
ncbi:MAG: aldehyde ferredoxin oxidoreductase C-terminal domain-containing protein, partial [Lachnospiraceae bacterium]|nr:aldehyde ferredoxin oxidoreductase C-terminal domain-containing protein [Lachnospiraceae bacterium]